MIIALTYILFLDDFISICHGCGISKLLLVGHSRNLIIFIYTFAFFIWVSRL